MEESLFDYKILLDEIIEGYAIHEMIYEDNKPIDYLIIDVNKSFEIYTGLKKENIISKRATDVYSQDKAPYIDIYNEVVKNNIIKSFEVFFKHFNKHYKIKAIPLKDNFFATVFEDISLLKSQEIDINEKQVFTKVALNSIGDGIISVDLNGNITGVNPTVEKLFNKEEKYFIGESAFNLSNKLKDIDSELLLSAFKKVINERVIYKSKKSYKINDSENYISITASPIINFSNITIGAIITLFDETERYLKNSELIRSEKKYRAIFDYSKDAKLTMNIKDYKFTEANAAFYNMFEIPENTSIKELTPYDISADTQKTGVNPKTAVSDYINECLETGSKYFNWKHKKTGGDIFYSTTLLTYVDIDDNPFIQVTIRDIDKQVKTKKQLIETKEFLSIRNKISNAFILDKTDKFYSESLKIIMQDFSAKFGLFGFIDEEGNLIAPSLTKEIWGENKFDNKPMVFPPDKWSGIWGDSINNKQAYIKNNDLNVPKGHTPLENAISAPVILHDKVIGLIILGNNKTNFNEKDKQKLESYCSYISPLLSSRLEDKKNKKKIIEAKDKAEESDRLKSAFIANMSHEIRTPMNGILGFVGLIQEMDLSKEEINKFVAQIEKSGKRMINILSDIMEISKIESNTSEIRKTNVDINSVIDDLYEFYEHDIRTKGIKFEYVKGIPNDEFFINVDRTKLNQILSNLISNSIKFTNKGSITYGYSINEKTIEFFVKDTGKGIKKENQSKIFERFIQEDISLSRKHEGAGLGLSISKAFVELMGGKLWLESEYKKGSTFYFTIPV